MATTTFSCWKRIFYAIGITVALTACNKNETIKQEPDPDPPKIVLEAGDTGIYPLKVGASITLEPAVENVADAVYTWLLNDKIVDSGKQYKGYIFSENTPGQYYVTLRVETPYGRDEADFRMDVSELAPPVISFGLPEGTMNALAGSDYHIAPIVLNSENARFEWKLNGVMAGEGTSYLFNQTEQKDYLLTLTVTNEDGMDEAALLITVLDELPLKVLFEKPMFTRESTDVSLFTGQKAYLWPIVEGGTDLSYQWFMDGAELSGETGERLVFSPDREGEFTVTVVVTSGSSAQVETLGRGITRSGFTRLAASVRVSCFGAEPEAGRPATAASSAEPSRVYEYVPAPGQFINEESLSGFSGEDTFESAAAYAEKRLAGGHYVSLGAFGGYVTVGFDHSIQNKGIHEGYDFAIAGNPFQGGSEPGIVWVMQDANGNGLPDDVWYELKGSEAGKTGTVQRYAITYVRPAGDRSAVAWQDNQGSSGQIEHLSFHTQSSYYPGWITTDSYTLRGTRLENNAYIDGYDWVLPGYEWGYADNAGTDRLNGGDNPSAESQNVYFRISNAVYPDGTPASLRYIDFIKVQTGIHAQCGHLGESSTEVFSFRDLNIR